MGPFIVDSDKASVGYSLSVDVLGGVETRDPDDDFCVDVEPDEEIKGSCLGIQKVFMWCWWARKKHARGGSVARGAPRLSTPAQVQVQ